MAGEASLDELKDRLDHFRRAFEMCELIDHWPDVVACRQRNQAHIDRIGEEIKKRQQAGEM